MPFISNSFGNILNLGISGKISIGIIFICCGSMIDFYLRNWRNQVPFFIYLNHQLNRKNIQIYNAIQTVVIWIYRTG